MKKLSIRTLALLFLGLLAGMMFTLVLRAQSDRPRRENRVLLIFETSSAMKKRVPSEVKSLRRLFALSLAEQLHRGDTIGAWTFGKDLRAGAFPLQNWQPEDITYIASNVITFMQAQHYTGAGDFNNLVPTLNQVINNSGRLTTLIFCDGETPINGTAYDSSINDVFKQHVHEMEKFKEPFVIVFKTENGKFISSTINAAESINVPPFPEPRPQPATPLFSPAPAEAPAPVSTAPPLIIIGTKKENNPPPVTAPATAPAAPEIQTPPPQSPIVISNPPPTVVSPPPQSMAAEPTNTIASATSPPSTPPVPAQTTVASASPPEAPSAGKGILLSVGVAILAVVGVGAFLMTRRSHRQHSGSLITESLKKR